VTNTSSTESDGADSGNTGSGNTGSGNTGSGNADPGNAGAGKAGTDNADTICVLLVDDDHDVLGANARYLRVNDLSVIVADNAGAALKRLQAEPVDIIVTDLRMPERDGLVFAREVREITPLLPIVFFSGYATVPEIVEAMKLGAVDFLEKAVEPEQLLNKIKSVTTGFRSEIALQRQALDISDTTVSLRRRVRAYEKYVIESCLLQHNGRISCVLEALDINRRTLNEKMTRLGIVRHPQ
jgi:DNA-binding NtrC family response regulator